MKDGRFVPCFERPQRLDQVLAAVAEQGWPVTAPSSADPMPAIAQVHDQDYLSFLQQVHGDWVAAARSGDVLPLVWPRPGLRQDLTAEQLGLDGRIGLYCFDSGSPICAGTWEAMLAGARCALSAVAVLNDGAALAASLSRPPGHHAARALYGGYCYVNFAAVAAQALIDRGAKRVVDLEVDYHHGNDTQAIFYDRPDVLVVNIHSDPRQEYPYYLGHAEETGTGAGEACTLNLPLPKGTDWSGYRSALAEATAAIRRFGADALIVSFGADTFQHDPLGRFALSTADYPVLGADIAALQLPTAVILEGGYAIDALGANVVGFLQGLAN